MIRAAALGASLALATHLASAGEPTRVPVTEDYLLHCSACHRTDGTGTPGTVPTLVGVGSLLAEAGGREYLVRVPGVAQAALSDERLARLLNWVLAEFSAVEAGYSAAEVARLRAAPLRDPASARPR